MAIKDMVTEEAPQEERLSKDEEDDLTIMVTLAENLIDDGGINVINQAESSNDPGTVIGQFMMQLASQIAETLPENLKPSPRIMFAHGGWVEQVSDYLQEEYDIPKEVMDRAEIFVASASQQMSQGQAQKQQAPAQPAMPQGPAAGGMV